MCRCSACVACAEAGMSLEMNASVITANRGQRRDVFAGVLPQAHDRAVLAWPAVAAGQRVLPVLRARQAPRLQAADGALQFEQPEQVDGSSSQCSASTGHVKVAAPQVMKATLAPTETRRSSRTSRELKASSVSAAAAQAVSSVTVTRQSGGAPGGRQVSKKAALRRDDCHRGGAHRGVAHVDDDRATEALTVLLVQPSGHGGVGARPSAPGPQRVLAGIATGLDRPHCGQLGHHTQRVDAREGPGQRGQMDRPDAQTWCGCRCRYKCGCGCGCGCGCRSGCRHARRVRDGLIHRCLHQHRFGADAPGWWVHRMLAVVVVGRRRIAAGVPAASALGRAA